MFWFKSFWRYDYLFSQNEWVESLIVHIKEIAYLHAMVWSSDIKGSSAVI